MVSPGDSRSHAFVSRSRPDGAEACSLLIFRAEPLPALETAHAEECWSGASLPRWQSRRGAAPAQGDPPFQEASTSIAEDG